MTTGQPIIGVWTQLGRGYTQVRLPSWKHFLDFVVGDLLNYESYIWRGQRCEDWRLEPTLDRLIREAKGQRVRSADFRQKHLEEFKFAARGRRGANPSVITDEDDWWALGQHHGLATPLLDWTKSPFVAAFFAFSEAAACPSGYRAIFALHEPSIEGWSKKNHWNQELARKSQLAELENPIARAFAEVPTRPELVVVRPLSDENQRLVNQGGLFTRLHSDKSLEDWVTSNHPDEITGMSLVKFLVPNQERDTALKSLNRMNINSMSLFPDLSGCSQFCNLRSEIENY